MKLVIMLSEKQNVIMIFLDFAYFIYLTIIWFLLNVLKQNANKILYKIYMV